MEITFKTKIKQQVEAAGYWIDNTTEEILYGGAKGGGKSYLGASLIFGDALIYPGTHYFIARKELIDIRKYTIPTIYEVFKNWGLKLDDYAKLDGNLNAYSLYNGSKVFLISCHEEPSDPLFEKFGSMQMTRGWIEEGGEVAESAKSNLWLSIGRWRNEDYKLKKKLLITANPKKGWMKREFVDPFKEGLLPFNRKYIQAFATDNVYLSDDYRDTLKKEKNQVTRQRLWEGNWDYDESKDSMISFDALTDAFSNTVVKDGQKYMTVDVARKGKDSTVDGCWEGLELYKIDQYFKQDIEKTKQTIRDKTASEQIPWSNTIIDEDGVGGGVVDGLQGVKGFVANSRALPTRAEIRQRQAKIQSDLYPKTNFANLKTQCAFKLAELINERKIKFNVPDYRDKIIEELTALLRYKDIDSDGKLAIKPKDEVKEELGRSPDLGDMIIFRMWFEIKKDALDEDPNEKQTVIRLEEQFAINQKNFNNNSNK